MIESASLSPEYYQYITSLREFDKSYDPKDPLNNPVQLYSNTSNKVGIFAGYIQNRDTIR